MKIYKRIRSSLKRSLKRIPLVRRLWKSFNIVMLRQGSTRRWRSKLDSELNFWRVFVSTQGSKWPEEYQMRLDPNLALQGYIKDLLEQEWAETYAILDVGAGPMTVLGKVWEDGHEIRITPVDALANDYRKVLNAEGIVPPVWTEEAEAERLSERFSEESFDLVYGRNSIDHCYDPLKAIKEMLKVVKRGRYVLLRHHENEGERASYATLHQWNFTERDGEFVIWNPYQEIVVGTALAGSAKIWCYRDEGLICMKMQKL